MTSVAEQRCIFDFRPDDEALVGVREVNPEQKQRGDSQAATDEYESRGAEEGSLVREVSDRMVCSACSCSFSNREDQMEHYKLDWHRFNLKQKMSGIPPATAEEFEKKSGAGEMSSISGSGSDSEEDDLDREAGGTDINAAGADDNNSDDTRVSTSRLSGKVFFLNSAGQYLSVLRCILQGKSDGDQDLGSSLKALSKTTLWIILMTGGGHFAGAVFQGKEILQHKTFHRYTVRAKRGTAQGLRDSQNRSHAPKSAGAALRRHNEAALVKDIQDLLMTWGEHLKEASAIFIRAPSYNKTIFFGGRTAPIDKKDPRVCTLPFATRRATFREVQRVHGVLSTVHIYGRDTDLSAVCSASKKPWKKTVNSQPEMDQEKDKEDPNSSDEEQEVELQLDVVELTLTTLDLKEFEVKPSRQKKRRRRKKDDERKQDEDSAELYNKDTEIEHEVEVPVADEASPEKQSKNKSWRKEKSKKQAKETVDESWEYGVRDELFTACKVGDVDGLNRVLHPAVENPLCATSDTSDTPSPRTLLNEPIDFSGFTLLHVASAAAQRAVVRLLLDAGADPAIRDNKGQTPYIVAPDKDTRNAFRKYMGENPDRYDYGKALVPGPLTAEIESKKMEKKKAQRALKKQREKTQKEEKKKEELEAEEKRRFASLSDREKRALAAERRLAEQVAAAGENLSNIKRCWQCGESLLGRTPFHYLDFSFCSPRCVQAHRKANAPAGKS